MYTVNKVYDGMWVPFGTKNKLCHQHPRQVISYEVFQMHIDYLKEFACTYNGTLPQIELVHLNLTNFLNLLSALPVAPPTLYNKPCNKPKYSWKMVSTVGISLEGSMITSINFARHFFNSL